jgi:hypothetical protein
MGIEDAEMFISLNNPWQRLWLLFLLALWGVLLFGGFIFGSSEEEGRRMPKWTRLSSSAVLVLAGWSWLLFTRNQPVFIYALLIALGMSFGFLGDLFIAGFFTGSGGKIGGIASFALGHICYIIAIFWLLGFGLNASTTVALVVWWLIAIVGWYFIVYRGASVTRLHWLVLPYALLLATTTGAATALALQEPAFWSLVIGAALFLLSDMILGGEWFNNLRLPFIHDIIWLMYGPGQMLIVYSIPVAATVLLFE